MIDDVNDVFIFKKTIFKLLTLILINYARFLDTINNVTLLTRVLIFKFSFFNVTNLKCFAQITLYSRINNKTDIEKSFLQFNDFHETHII